MVGEGPKEEVRFELGLKNRVQPGQAERKWEDHPQQWESTHVALTTGWVWPTVGALGKGWSP